MAGFYESFRFVWRGGEGIALARPAAQAEGCECIL